MKTQINLGCDFSPIHVETILELKRQEIVYDMPTTLYSVYGSPREGNPFGSVRPSSRESEVHTEQFKAGLVALREAGIKICLTFNSLFPHLKYTKIMQSVFDSKQAQHELDCFVESYKDLVDYWIIAHPYLMDKFHEYPERWGLKIIASTIMNIHSLPQLIWVKENWPRVAKVCPALWRNREFNWLSAANKIIPLELLANEFCSIGGVECEGLYRQACYMSQSMEVIGWNPMVARCIKSREGNVGAWLRSRFILPQWLSAYERFTGVHDFKVTGRTHSASYILAIGLAYMRNDISCNLLSLWGQLEATLDKGNWEIRQREATGKVDIPISKVIPLIEEIGCCTCDICGHTCNRCVEAYNKL